MPQVVHLYEFCRMLLFSDRQLNVDIALPFVSPRTSIVCWKELVPWTGAVLENSAAYWLLPENCADQNCAEWPVPRSSSDDVLNESVMT